MLVPGILFFATIGAIFGSFSGAQVWRLRARQLVEDKRAGDKVDADEYRRLKPLIVKTQDDRSHCLKCQKVLAWYDLIPVISWLSTAGRCRYCHARIGAFEIVMEIGYTVFFVLSYLVFAPELGSWFGISRFVIWLIAGVLMGILFAYDAKWFLLPERINIALIVCAGIYLILTYIKSGVTPEALWSLVGSLLIMSGIYLFIFIISRGTWIGFGDIILGIGLGLLLVEWHSAFLALFLANVLGLVMVLPAYVKKEVSGKTHIPFGPFLITATILVVLYGPTIMNVATQWLDSVTNLIFNTFML